ncbi:GNAT family N-acetyltransferase [Anoxynatronum buryatiense]|uniref:Protein N-acetyltransferase, RimJ/RimL family n=1 Tax=Anoxynatronum buryatiense TaxID=489973 RepID=A0AA46AJB5_9CLOT|nr:GNAT family protein [Anoxynatronum buryatiense]SMP60309.1 Protein N-acetyltransferase, RimJ/RimL family [Anoxynatronum buryatiense]
MTQAVVENQHIRLRQTAPEDLDWVIATEQHPDNREYVYNWPRERHLAGIASEDEKHFMIMRVEDDCPVGYVILSGLASEHQVISFDRITIAEKGRGYGRQTVRLIKQLCFETYKCHRLWLDVFDFNPRARRLYESEGFVFEGTLRECKKKGDDFLSMHVLSMLEREYREWTPVDDFATER